MLEHGYSRRRFINDAATVSAGLTLSDWALSKPVNALQQQTTQTRIDPQSQVRPPFRSDFCARVCTHGPDASVAMQMLEESLVGLGTDHFDLWHLHAVVYDNDPELAYRTGGAIEALDRAKKQGKVRYVGFTGHKDPRIHKHMIDLGYTWDAMQFPINAFDAQFRSFQQIVLSDATQRGIAVLGMKPLNGDVPVQPVPVKYPSSPAIDRMFALAAMQGNNAEFDMAQLALRRGAANEVKSYAGKMIAEHEGLMKEMQPVLSRTLGAAEPARTTRCA